MDKSQSVSLAVSQLKRFESESANSTKAANAIRTFALLKDYWESFRSVSIFSTFISEESRLVQVDDVKVWIDRLGESLGDSNLELHIDHKAGAWVHRCGFLVWVVQLSLDLILQSRRGKPRACLGFESLLNLSDQDVPMCFVDESLNIIQVRLHFRRIGPALEEEVWSLLFVLGLLEPFLGSASVNARLLAGSWKRVPILVNHLVCKC